MLELPAEEMSSINVLVPSLVPVRPVVSHVDGSSTPPAPPTRGRAASRAQAAPGATPSAPPAPIRPTGAPAPPSPEATTSIHPEAYGFVPELVPDRASAPADRTAAARELVALCENELKETRERTRRARLHYECARLYEVPLFDLDAALDHYQQARALASQHGPTISGLRRVRFLRSEWEAALKALSEELELAPGPNERGALHFLRGQLLEQRLFRPADARAAYAQALAQMPSDGATLRALLRAARREKKPLEIRSLLDRLAEAAASDLPLQAARLAARARATELGGGELADALAFYERAIQTDPMASGALAHAERIYAKTGAHQKLVELGERRVGLLTSPRRRAAALMGAAEVSAERLGNRAHAQKLLERAAQEVPTDPGPLSRLADLYQAAGDHQGELRNLLKLEGLASEPALKIELRLRIAELYQLRLDSRADATTWFERARELSPALPAAADSLAEIYRQREDWTALVSVLAGRETASEDVDQRATLHIEVAEIQERRLGDVASAITSLKAATGLVPNHPGAYGALTRLLHREHRYAELVEVHEAQVELAADDDDAIMHLLAAAQIQEDLLAQPIAALAAFQRILEREPKSLIALRGAVRVALAAGKPQVAIDALMAEAALAKENAPRVALHLRAAEIAERHLGSLEQATQLYRQVTQEAPTSRPALAALARIYRAAGYHKELMHVMNQELGALPSRQARAEHLLRMGQVAERLLSDDTLALDTYKKALTEEPTSTHAASALERVLERRGKHEVLAQHLENRLRHEKDEQERQRVARDLARIYEFRLGKAKEALHAYEAALAVDPDDQLAQGGRVRCLGVLGDFAKLVEATSEGPLASGDESASELSTMLAAEILEGELDRPADAAKRYETLLEHKPNHRGALEGLERLAVQTPPAEELIRVLKGQVVSYQAELERVSALRELARLGEQDGERGKALRREAAAGVLEMRPEDERALLAQELWALGTKDLAQLARVDQVRVRTVTALDQRAAGRTRLGEYLEWQNPGLALEMHRPALLDDAESIGAARGMTRLAEMIGSVELLAEAAETESRVVQSRERVSSLFRRAAAAQRDSGNADAAAKLLMRALELYPDDAQSAQELQRTQAADGHFETLIATLQAAATSATDPEVRAGHWISLARLMATARQDVQGAIAALVRVEKAQPNHVPTLIELSELYLRDRQWAPAAARLERAILATQDVDQGRAARLRLAEIYHEHLEKVVDATRLLREVLRTAPSERAALRRLLNIEIATGKSSARQTAEAWVAAASGLELGEALTTLGRLQRDAGQSADAIASWTRAVELSGYEEKGAARDVVRHLEAEAKAGRRADFAPYARALEAFCHSSAEPARRADSYLELGRVYFERMSDARSGEAALRFGLKLAPSHAGLRWELAERLCGQGHFDRALPELFEFLSLDVQRLDAWSRLTQAFDATGQNAEAHLALGPLTFLGGGSDLQRSTWNSRRAHTALAAEGTGSLAVWSSLPRALPEETRGLLGQLAPLLSKIYPSDVSRLGVGTRERVGPRAAHPVRPLLDRLLRSFRGLEIDLYIGPPGSALGYVLSDPVGIVVPPELAGLSEAEQAFCLGRFVCATALDAQVVVALGSPQAELLLSACAAAVGFSAPPARGDAGELAELTRRVTKALPWLAKGRFEDAARTYAARPLANPALSLFDLERASFRSALVLADDLGGLSLLARHGRLFGLDDAAARWLVTDLLGFWVSAPAMSMRREMALL
jgi:predicted Zn-dependent protease